MVQLAERATAEKIIELENVQFSYSSRRALVLDIPRWQVSAGQQMFVHGPSGCGKTTLLNLLTGMLTPSSGSIRLLGETVSALRGHQRDRFRARHIGIVFQQFNLISYLSVADNIRLAAHFGKHAEAPGEDTLATLLEQLQMPGTLLKQRADQLSVGQQQRVAIARALINRPEILIVDEPTSALDSDAGAAFMKLLLSISRGNNSTLLFVSHDQRLAANFDETFNLTELNQAQSHVA